MKNVNMLQQIYIDIYTDKSYTYISIKKINIANAIYQYFRYIDILFPSLSWWRNVKATQECDHVNVITQITYETNMKFQ